jgi:hypothetical protein
MDLDYLFEGNNEGMNPVFLATEGQDEALEYLLKFVKEKKDRSSQFTGKKQKWESFSPGLL